VEEVIDVKRIKSEIQSANFGAEPQILFSLGHQGEEISDIGAVEGLREFGKDKLIPVGNFCDDAAVASVELTDRRVSAGTVFLVGVDISSAMMR
jgi:hypothetical protein